MSSQCVATIAASGTTSDAVKLSATHAVHAVAFPSAMTGTYSTGCTDIAGTVI